MNKQYVNQSSRSFRKQWGRRTSFSSGKMAKDALLYRWDWIEYESETECCKTVFQCIIILTLKSNPKEIFIRLTVVWIKHNSFIDGFFSSGMIRQYSYQYINFTKFCNSLKISWKSLFYFLIKPTSHKGR
jgi:hypothetical protein